MFRTSFRARIVVLFTLIAGVVVFASVKFGPVSEAEDRKGSQKSAPEAPQAAVVTATLTDNVTAATKVAPGGTITYTATITNGGATSPADDATSVIFTDQLDANTTLVPGSLAVTPIVTNDTYNGLVGNISLTKNAAEGVLANDLNPLTGSNLGLTAGGPATSAQGGNVTMNADGSFTYDPPAGYTGADTYTYTITGTNVAPTNGTITWNISGMIWFINNNATACTVAGCGRLSNPFSTAAAFTTLNNGTGNNPAAGDNVFIYESAAAYNDAVNLLNGQKLFGQDSTSTLTALTGLTPPAGSPALPATNSGNGVITKITTTGANNGINLAAAAAGYTVDGLAIGNTFGCGISGSNFGTLTVANLNISEPSSTRTGQALCLNTGTLNGTIGNITSGSTGSNGIALTGIAGTMNVTGATTISNAPTAGILISSSTVTVHFGNTSVTGCAVGLRFQNNSSGTRSFGTLNISGISGNAFLHGVTGGNVTVTGAATLTSAGDAISVSTPGGTDVVNFQAATSATRTAAGGNGVNWAGTAGASISFLALTVQTNAGTGLNATGGGTVTVTNSTGTINNTAGPAIVANAVTLNVNFASINSSGGTNGVSLTNVGGSSVFGTATINGQTGDGVNITNSAGNVTINGGTIGNPAGNAVEVNGSNGNVTIAAALTKTTAGKIVLVTGRTGNTVALSGNISATGALDNGIDVNNNTAGIVNFTGQNQTLTTGANTAVNLFTNGTGVVSFAPVAGGNGLDITTTSGLGFRAETGGTVTVQGAGNTINSGTGTALRIVSATIAATNITFQSISANGAANGIFLNATGSSGGLTVTGNGGTCTFTTPTCDGGRIQSTAGADNTTSGIGVYLLDTVNVSLTRMRIDNHPNFAIRGHGVTGLTLQNVVIDGNNGTNSTADVDIVNGEDSVRIINLTGSALIDDSFIGGGYEQNIRIVNDTGLLNRLTVSDSSIGDLDGAGPGRGVDPTNGDDNIVFSAADGTLTQMNGTFTNNILNNARGDVFQAANSDVSAPQAAMDIVFRGNTVSNNHPNIVIAGGGVTFNGTGAMTYDISCNKFRDSKGHGLNVFKQRPASGQTGGTWSGTIFNNRIGVTGVLQSGGAGIGLNVEAQGNGTHTTLIKNNQIINYATAGIFVGVVDANTSGPTALTMIATVIGNTTTEPDPVNAFAGFHTNQGAVSPADATTTLNLKLGGAGAEQNNFVNGDPSNGNDVALQRSAGAIGTFTLTQGASGVSTPVTTVVQNNNAAPITLFADAGITVVGPVPTLPAATDQTCSPPPIPPPGGESIGMAFLGEGGFGTNDLLAILSAERPADVAKALRTSEMASVNAEMPFWASIMPSADSIKASGSVEMASWNSIKASGDSIMAPAESIKAEGLGIKAEGFAELAPTDVAKAPVESEKPSALFAMASAIAEMISPTVYSAESTPFSGETITVNGTGTGFTLPAGKTVTITYQATVNFPPQVKSVTTQGTVTGNGPGAFNILTDDPEPAGGPQATVTQVDTLMTWNGATSTDWNTATNWTPPAGGTAYAPGVSNPAINDVVIPSGALPNQPNISATDITVYSLVVSNGRTLTITSPRILTMGGTPGGNLQLDGIISGGEFRFGTGTHVLTNAAGTGSFSSTNLARVLSGSTVTLNQNLQAGAFVVDGGGTLNITNRTVSLNGPGGLSVPGGTLTTTGSTVIFNGSGAVPQSLGAVTLNNMSVNNTGAGVSLTGSPTVNATFSLIQGNVTTGAANTLIVASGGTANRAAGAVLGKVQKVVVGGARPAEAPEAPQAIFLFPVGTATGYSPVTANFTAASNGNLTVEAFDNTMPAVPALNDLTTLDRHWQMTEGGTLTADLTLQYLLADVDGTETNYRLIRGTGGVANVFPNNCASTCVNAVAHTILAVGTTSFDSFWTAGEPLAPTAANVGVSGRVYTNAGRGVAGAIVRMTDQSGNVVHALTNPFGYYHFEGVASGQDYVVTVTSKQYTFAPRLVSVSDSITDLDFVAEGKE